MAQSPCEKCAIITLDSLRARFSHHASTDDLLLSAQSCQLCSLIVHSAIHWTGQISVDDKTALDKNDSKEMNLLLKAALGHHKLDLEHGVAISLEYTRATTGMVIIQGVGKLINSGKGIAVVLGRLRIFTTKSSIPDIPSGHVITPSLDLDALVRQVGKWMKECRIAHKLCVSPKQDNTRRLEPQLPRRVLDLRDVESNGIVRLWETEAVRCDYVALSHRWGGSTPIKTLGANVNERKNGFAFHELPQTFQDACIVACKLNIYYVWIDSLCIIQDSEEDWRQEAAKMGDVYQNAILTIAATAAQNSDTGFLRPRHMSGYVRVPIHSNQEPTSDDVVFLDLGNYRNLKDDVDDRELNKRGWVLQERALSARILHFSNTQVYWECWTHQLREDGQVHRRQKQKSQTFPALLSPSSVSGSKEETPKQWYRLVETYTASELTRQSDKLVAIGGLVQRLESQTGQKFSHGFWEDCYHEGLLWVRRSKKSLEHIPDTKEPTWSWASWNGAVGDVAMNTEYAVNKDLTIVQERIEGDLVRAHLRAKAYTLDTSCEIVEESSTMRPPQLLRYTSTTLQINAEGQFIGWVLLDQIDKIDVTAVKELLWIISTVFFTSLTEKDEAASEQELEEKQRPVCLLVQKTSAETYVRVGVGHIHSRKWLALYQDHVVVV